MKGKFMRVILLGLALGLWFSPLANGQSVPTPKDDRTPQKIALDRAIQAYEATNVTAVLNPSHRLVVGDVIDMKVFQEEELNVRTRLDSSGAISIPLVGSIKVTGKTVEEAQRLIRDVLNKDYLQNAQVSLSVLELAKKRFSILGEVKQPGFYVIPEGETMDVLQAIAMAGGYTPFARGGKVTIKRNADGRETVLKINAKSMAKKESAAPVEIESNDIIVVDTALF